MNVFGDTHNTTYNITNHITINAIDPSTGSHSTGNPSTGKPSTGNHSNGNPGFMVALVLSMFLIASKPFSIVFGKFSQSALMSRSIS